MFPLFRLAHYHICLASWVSCLFTAPSPPCHRRLSAISALSAAQPHWQSGNRMQSRKRQEHSALRRHKQDCKFNNSLGASGQLGVDSRAFKCKCVGVGGGDQRREGGSGEGEKKGALSTCMVRATNLAEALGLNCGSQL